MRVPPPTVSAIIGESSRSPVRYFGMVAGVGLLGLVAGAVPARLVVRLRALPRLG